MLSKEGTSVNPSDRAASQAQPRVAVVALTRTGGTLKYGQLMAAALAKLCPVRVILSSSYFDRYEFPQEADCVYLPTGRGSAGIVLNSLNPLRYWQVIRAVRAFRPDVVWVPAEHAWTPVIGSALRAWPIVQTIHDVAHHKGEESRFYLSLRQFVLEMATRFVVLSQWARKQLVEQIGPESVSVVPLGAFVPGTGLEAPAFSPAPGKGGVLFFGRMAPYKGLDILLKAFQVAARRFPHAHLRIVSGGDISSYSELLRQTPNVTLTNRFVPEKEICQILQESDFLVAPYIDASQSGVLPMVLTTGRAVIASDVGGLPEQFTPGQSGLLVPPGDVQRLAEAIETLLGDPQMARKMGEHGRQEYLTRFWWDRLAGELLAVLRQAIEEFQPKRHSMIRAWGRMAGFALGTGVRWICRCGERS